VNQLSYPRGMAGSLVSYLMLFPSCQVPNPHAFPFMNPSFGAFLLYEFMLYLLISLLSPHPM